MPLPPPDPKESLGVGYFPYALVSHFLASSLLVARSRSSSSRNLFSRFGFLEALVSQAHGDTVGYAEVLPREADYKESSRQEVQLLNG